MFILYFVLVVCVLISVAFITLMERKILGYVQIRKGPNKLSIIGILQPLADAVKLFSKENNNNYNFNYYLYLVPPFLALLFMFLFWYSYIYSFFTIYIMSMIYILMISSFSVYVIILSGWSSNSKYSLLGAYRGVAQVISYEVSMAFLFLTLMILYKTFSFSDIIKVSFISNLYLVLFMFLAFLISILAETNRTPFDFSEGESELVSGFNIEYGAGGFAILFMAEYGNIMFMSYFISMLFLNNFQLIFSVVILYLILLIRGTYPRFRYDNLMMMAWKVILPFSICSFINVFVMQLF